MTGHARDSRGQIIAMQAQACRSTRSPIWDVVNDNRGRNMGQREDMSEWLSSAEQAIRMPVACRYMLGDGKWRYQREWSEGANVHPVYEMKAEDLAALNRTRR